VLFSKLTRATPYTDFEVFELWRKLFMTSVFVFVSDDTSAQVTFLLITCSISIVVLGWLNPYGTFF
jgi:hypothetical protein